MPGSDHEFFAWLNFPGRRGPAYPLSGYRAVAEFRQMLSAIRPGVKTPQRWDGVLFFAVTAEHEGDWDFVFRGRQDGIYFNLSPEDWAAVREVFRRAWDLPEVRDAWAALSSREEGQ